MERHPLDLISLTAGLIFTATAALGLTGAISLGLDDLRWIGPAVLVLFGVVLVATSVSRRDERTVEAAATSATSDTTDSSGSGTAPAASDGSPAVR